MVPLVVLVAIFCSVSSIVQSASFNPNEATELQEETRGLLQEEARGQATELQEEARGISDDPNVLTDVDRNLVVIGGARNGDGTAGSLTVIDYDKNVIGIYDAKTRSCYLTRGQPKSSLPNPAEIQNVPNAPQSGETPTDRQAGGDASVPDRTLLPGPLKETCDGLRLKWMGPKTTGDESLGRPRRFWGLIGGAAKWGIGRVINRVSNRRRCRY